MRTLIYAWGSRGDVQPYLALARALNRAGHDAVLAGPERFAGLAQEHGVEFHPRDQGLLDFYVQDEDISEWLRDQGAVRRGKMALRKRALNKLAGEFFRRFPRMLADISSAGERGADLVVQSYEELPFEQGHHVAEKLGAPVVLATLFPNYVPSAHYPAKFLPADRTFPRVLRRLSHLPGALLPPIGKAGVDAWRSDVLGLPARRNQHDRLRRPDGGRVPVLHGFSPHLVPPAPDWPAWVFTTGFWFLPPRADYSPPAELAAFLDGGEPPVCVTLGTVRGMDPVEAGRLVVEAVRLAGVRAVVVRASGSLEVADPPPGVLVVDDVPYPWLFPRTAAVVSAAGVGTVNEALRVGVPQVTCPVHNEQLMWAVLARDAGVAGEPLRNRDLTPARLADAIRAVLADRSTGDRARALARVVDAERGAENAVELLERLHARRDKLTAPVR
ncbi:glycosyltransferase [Actinosynnema mirum]|uniref:Sterol 3-beta-glucosyltransferase n=1 Tax=Actinosynnema mirum (strain ATCC 29888 / DSM 43827 / JCM 3225 / NBRC 14064 / NCIMB 13271 / NRRL B-12336 / IMRU 3971 / 101) TaxID=446462 RepID=C6WPG6_ACTMD|nr:glycosyltransferase [Actinosynnema mirum]ACU38668.1 Sterol 3-beta-glucosyltransferase [Actinosynnema mirum DSM 43827]